MDRLARRRGCVGGPVWDANEVWLIAAGGVLFLSFPRTYAAAFSGFYLALIMILWLLILRGIAIGFRSHQANPLWREFWDATFSLASVLLALVLGTALGNVVRGVPLDATGFFYLPLFTNLRPGQHPGVFDWYTILVGCLALCILAGHGASGPGRARAQQQADEHILHGLEYLTQMRMHLCMGDDPASATAIRERTLIVDFGDIVLHRSPTSSRGQGRGAV